MSALSSCLGMGRVAVLTGAAGSGKTTVWQTLLGCLQGQGRQVPLCLFSSCCCCCCVLHAESFSSQCRGLGEVACMTSRTALLRQKCV